MQLPPIKPTGRQPAAERRPSACEADTTLEFGRFRLLLRQRQLLADGVPVELGTRAFDLLMALLTADGALVSKDELQRLVWPGIVVSEDNLKVQISTLRRALGEDRDLIRTEIGRGYRFTAAVSSTSRRNECRRRPQWLGRPGPRPFHKWTIRCTPRREFDFRKCPADEGARSWS